MRLLERIRVSLRNWLLKPTAAERAQIEAMFASTERRLSELHRALDLPGGAEIRQPERVH